MTIHLDGPQRSADLILSGAKELEKNVEGLAKVGLQELKDVISSSNRILPDIFPKFEIEGKDHLATDKTGDTAAQARKRLFGEFEKGVEAVKPDACTQPYNIGNCYFVAAMASLAKVNPQAIVDMIKVNDNGTYTVKFPGAAKEITVSQPSDAEHSQVGGKTKYGDWPLILMKAYGKYCGGGKSDIDGSDGGSAFSAGVRVLTDKGVVNYGIGYMIPLQSWSGLDSELKSALNTKDALPVTVSTAKSLFSETTKDGFVRQHVYSVLEYKPNPNDVRQSRVVVRNPHGGPNATREISLQQFSDNFLQLSIPRR